MKDFVIPFRDATNWRAHFCVFTKRSELNDGIVRAEFYVADQSNFADALSKNDEEKGQCARENEGCASVAFGWKVSSMVGDTSGCGF